MTRRRKSSVFIGIQIRFGVGRVIGQWACFMFASATISCCIYIHMYMEQEHGTRNKKNTKKTRQRHQSQTRPNKQACAQGHEADIKQPRKATFDSTAVQQCSPQAVRVMSWFSFFLSCFLTEHGGTAAAVGWRVNHEALAEVDVSPVVVQLLAPGPPTVTPRWR